MVSKLDDFLMSKTTVVEKTKKDLVNANEGVKVTGDILINEVKNNFFRDW